MNDLPLPCPCRVIGVLDDGPAGLTAAALAALGAADLVIGCRRLLDTCDNHCLPTAERRDLTGRISQVPGWITSALASGRRVVVLATGDPLFHGIGGYLRARLPATTLEFLPNLSTLQLACARLGLAWQDLRFLSVHGRDSGEWQQDAGPEHGLYPIVQALQDIEAVSGQTASWPNPAIGHPKSVAQISLDPPLPNPPPSGGGERSGTVAHLAILTSPTNSPDRIARLLLQEGLGDVCRLAVMARLRRPDEQVLTDLSPATAAEMRFPEPNVVVITLRGLGRPPVLFGLADDSFLQRQPDRGLITKREVRALSLARLQLRADSVVWDIGAGSGALGLEAARLCPRGFIHAIEKNPADAAIVRENRRRLGITNYRLVQAKAPAGLADWPDPDAVFIGGSGGELPELIRLTLTRLRDGGWLVMNFVTLENLNLAMTLLKKMQVHWDLTQLQTARSQPILDMHRLVPENPVWVLAASREVPDAEGIERRHD